MVTPDPNQKKPSNPDETPEQETAETKPHDPPEGKPDGISLAVGDSAEVAKEGAAKASPPSKQKAPQRPAPYLKPKQSRLLPRDNKLNQIR